MTSILELDNIHANIENTTILEGISITLNEGESVALIGRNGAGKTTTFRSVWGKVDITQGDIKVRGDSIIGVPTEKRSRYGIAYAPENLKLFNNLTTIDNLRMPIWAGVTDEQDFQELLETILDIFPQIDDFIHQPVENLSGGQQRMVTVGRAIASDPDVILLDEPFEGLAPTIRTDLNEAIKEISQLGISTLIAESKVNQAREVADRFYVIERGKIIDEIKNAENLDDNETIIETFGTTKGD
jgi:branched-chain amino acid transport system ATP-binding protein